MKSFIASVLLGLVAFVGSAHAQQIVDVRVLDDASDFVLTFEGKEDVSPPFVRVSNGQVKLWFEDAGEQASIKQRLRTAPLGSVDVRSGSQGTAAVKIKFEEKVALNTGDVRIDTKGKLATVRIAKSVFPSLAPRPEPVKPVAKVETPAPAAVQAAQPAAAVAQPAAPAAQSAAAAPSAQAQPLSAAMAPQKPAGAPKAAEKAPTYAPPTGGSLAVLAAISALLALVYGVMRLVMKKGKQKPPAPIDIIAQKRLGARHQLIIVRAFGKDHLLSVQGGNTTRIASARAGQMLGENGAMNTSNLEYENENTAVRKQESLFGAALLRHALDDRLREASGGDSNPPGEREPDSVSGLLRLRREAGL